MVGLINRVSINEIMAICVNFEMMIMPKRLRNGFAKQKRNVQSLKGPEYFFKLLCPFLAQLGNTDSVSTCKMC